MSRRRRFGRWIAVLLASAVAVVAPVPMLTPSAEAAEPTEVESVRARLLAQPATSAAWAECDFDDAFQCTRVRVPRDWTNAGDPANDIWIAISYRKASGAGLGLLTTNPGGPGIEGREFTAGLAQVKPQLYRYDLLGFDPRGFGASTRVRCWVDQNRLNRLPQVADRRVRNRATHAVEVAEAKLLGEACSAAPRPGEISPRYVNTQQTVWDLDFIRDLIDTRNADRSYTKLNMIGYSYGTWLGAWYADTYPARVGKFILDSNMQWTASMYANQALDSPSFQRRRDKMYFPYLARHHDDFGLGKSTKAVKKKYESTRKKLAAQVKKNLKKGKPAGFGPEDLDYVTSILLYNDEDMTSAGFVLDAVADYVKKPSARTKRTMLKRVTPRMTKAPFVVQRSSKSVRASALVDISEGLAGTIVRCNDSVTPGNLTALLRRADADARKYSFTGYLNTIPLCAYWKFKPQTRTIDLAGVTSRILMFQSEGDPATLYEGALAAHRRTASRTALVSVDNEGQHGLYIDGPSRCVESLGDRFLFGTWRPTNTRCTTSPLPFDRKVYTLNGPVSGARSDAKKAVKAKNAKVKATRADVAKRGLS